MKAILESIIKETNTHRIIYGFIRKRLYLELTREQSIIFFFVCAGEFAWSYLSLLQVLEILKSNKCCRKTERVL